MHKLVQNRVKGRGYNLQSLRKYIISLMSVILFISFFSVKSSASFSVSAKSAILMDQASGRILYEHHAHTKRSIASITKIMTAILAIESGKLNEIVTVSPSAVRTEGSSIYLKPNEKIKLEDLVYGLMLRSGNDAAVAIAEYVGGSKEGFVYLMNQKAAEIGMTNTQFANPHGLDDQGKHYSTAYDMALLTRYAMQNKIYRKISGTKVHRAPNPYGKWDRVWKNKNKLLTGLYQYSTGGKTGYTTGARRTLVSTASKDGMDLIAVTLNDPHDWQDHINMFNYGFNHYDLVKIVDQGIYKNVKYKIYKDNVYIKRDFVYPLTSEEKKQVNLDVKLIKPKKTWDREGNIPKVIGQINIVLDNETIGKVPLYYDDDNSKELSNSLFDTLKNLFFSILGVNYYG